MTATTRGSPVGGNDSQGQGQAPDAQSQPPLPQNQVCFAAPVLGWGWGVAVGCHHFISMPHWFYSTTLFYFSRQKLMVCSNNGCVFQQWLSLHQFNFSNIFLSRMHKLEQHLHCNDGSVAESEPLCVCTILPREVGDILASTVMASKRLSHWGSKTKFKFDPRHR